MIRFGKMKMTAEHTSVWNGIEEEYAFKIICVDENGNEDVYYIVYPGDDEKVLNEIAEKYGVKKEDVRKAAEYLSYLYAKEPCEKCVEGGCGRCPDVIDYWDKVAKYKLGDFDIVEIDKKWEIMKKVL